MHHLRKISLEVMSFEVFGMVLLKMADMHNT